MKKIVKEKENKIEKILPSELSKKSFVAFIYGEDDPFAVGILRRIDENLYKVVSFDKEGNENYSGERTRCSMEELISYNLDYAELFAFDSLRELLKWIDEVLYC